MIYNKSRNILTVILLFSFFLLTSGFRSARLTYFVKSRILYKGSFFIVVLEHLDKKKKYRIDFIAGSRTNAYHLKIIRKQTLKLIAIPLGSPDKARLNLVENNEIIMQDEFRLLEKPVETVSVEVKQQYVYPPAGLNKQLWQEQQLVQSVKSILLDKIYFFQTPVRAIAGVTNTSTPFGYKRIFNKSRTNLHFGADLSARAGTPVHSVFDGVVKLSRELYFTGNTVFVHHGDNLVSLYAHLSKISVTNGQKIRKGDIVGLVGATGRVTGPHLHLGVFINGLAIDPMSLYEILK
ncbi:MAG: M23 family metallopeptidase [bacterium]|nr:M23 family metallopeptidase [bacterium]